MKCEDIHRGLDKEYMREFLSLQVRAARNKSKSMSSIEILEEIQALNEKLKFVQIREGIEQLIKELGWREWDVSNIVEDFKTGRYISFLGTEEEFNERFGEIE